MRHIMLLFLMCFFAIEFGSQHVVLSEFYSPSAYEYEEVDSVALRNEKLYDAFFRSMMFKECRNQCNVTSRNNMGGILSVGCVQITEVFCRQANINRHMHETGKKTLSCKELKKVPQYYNYRVDGVNIEKSKEIVYWVNKKHFDKYDLHGKVYDDNLWHKIITTHNRFAPPHYREDIMKMYHRKIKQL